MKDLIYFGMAFNERVVLWCVRWIPLDLRIDSLL
jgi:hypothetical protein